MTKSAVALRQDDLPGVPEPSSMVEGILRAARDPSVDADKMERLMALYERLEDRQAERTYNEALLAAQSEMEPVRADAKNDQTKSRYATYQALDTAIRPAYSKHGFSVSYDTEESPKTESVRVVGWVRHKDGHKEKFKVDMPADGKGAKGNDVMTKTHAVMSAVTYGKRELLGGIFNIVVTRDDDGNAAGGTLPLSEEDVEWIKDMIEKSHSDLEKFCTIIMKVESLSQLTKKDMPKAREALNEALSYWQRNRPKK